MANPDTPPKVMRRSAASIPPRTRGKAQQDPMGKRSPRQVTLDKQQISAANRAESPILKLPAELRIQIYEQVLLSSRALFVPPHLHRRRGPNLPVDCQCNFCKPSPACCGTSRAVQHGRCQKAHASLLRTCKQIYDEARSIFYGQNRFIVAFLDGRPYEAQNFFPFQLRLDTMCLMDTVIFRDACLCDKWKGGLRRSLRISGTNLAKSCFGSKTLSLRFLVWRSDAEVAMTVLWLAHFLDPMVARELYVKAPLAGGNEAADSLATPVPARTRLPAAKYLPCILLSTTRDAAAKAPEVRSKDPIQHPASSSLVVANPAVPPQAGENYCL
ncbi:hypothetical protein PG985_000648 [Apiospora marii]|uniref:DUF7730 domain-containing protein n=1 Tax=Apiospora marii TaxID=335849 RepID=A0ABR1R2L2_9PEZI